MAIDNQLDDQLGSYPPLTNDRSQPAGRFPALSARAPIDPDNPTWGLGGAVLVWFLSLVLMIFVPVIFVLPYVLTHGMGAIIDRTAIFLQIASLLPTHLLTFAMIWALVTRFGKSPFLRAIGCEWPGRFWPWISLFLGFVLFGAGVAIAKLVGADKPTQLEQIINSSVATRYAIAFLAVFTAPFVEEFLYRGVLFAALQRITGAVAAGLVTLGLFTLIHVPQYWPNLGVLAAVGFLSVALTIVRVKTGRLLPCIVIHFVFNGIQSVLLLVEPYFSNAGTVPDPAPALLIVARLALL